MKSSIWMFCALAGCATLFLSSAATVHVVYTIRVPYALFAAACVIGFPWVTAGWRAAPTWVRWSALALAAVYVAAAIVGTGDTLSVQRAGGYRDLVYLADLMLGLAIVSEIMKVHGGTVEIGDNAGGGATFTISFNRVTEAA